MTDPLLTVRPLTAADAASYRLVRLQALRGDPLAFVTTADEFAARTLQSIAAQIDHREHALTFGAFLAGELVGILSLVREHRPTIRHRADIYGVAVLSGARGQGCGDALLRSALAHAERWQEVTSVHLAVIETQHAARRLYERHGFMVWGTQPDAVQHAGTAYSEHWMWRPVPRRG